jgi:alpha/beta superfamily hydrolase
MAQNETFDIAGPAGRLESLLMNPEETPVAAAVVCHAHPLQGGIMHFKVIFRAAKALQQNGVAALRFNFRGVGRSEGKHDDGRGEQDDVIAALDEMTRRFPGLPLVLGGFSFGSWMSVLVSQRDPRVRGLVAMGFPLRLAGQVSLETARPMPRIFVQGENDEFGAARELQPLVERLPPPHEFAMIPGANHFFDGHLETVQQTISTWAARRPWEARG